MSRSGSIRSMRTRHLCTALAIALAGTTTATRAETAPGGFAAPAAAPLQHDFPVLRGLARNAARAPTTPARTPVVRSISSLADSGPGSLREALVTAVDGDVIDLAGVSGRIALSSALQPAASVVIQGPGRDALVLDAGHRDRVIATDHSLTLSGVTLANGKPAAPSGAYSVGGCLFVSGDLQLVNATISGCEVGDASTEAAYGGAVGVLGDAYIKYSSISDSRATAYLRAGGGGIALGGDVLLLYSSTISGNHAEQVVAVPETPRVPLGGPPEPFASGGGVLGPTFLILSQVTGNTATAEGDGISAHGNVLGGGVFATLGLVSYFGTVSGNVASGTGKALGGGIYLAGGIPGPRPAALPRWNLPPVITGTDPTIALTTIAGNQATSTLETATGGGLHLRSPTVLLGAAVRGNSADTDCAVCWSGGGGLVTSGPVVVVSSSVTGNSSRNTAGGHTVGGGIGAYYGESLVVANSTVSGNMTDTTGTTRGGGVAASNVEFLDSTIAFNRSAGPGGGIVLYGHTYPWVLQSTIVASNTSTDDPAAADLYAYEGPGLVVGGSHNIVVASSQATLPGDTLALDPLLLPLAYNGGRTLNHALGDGSPAIDAGNNASGESNDQRGFERVVGLGPDIGSYERDDDRIFYDAFDHL